jgi:hypothetical protein
VQDQELVLTTAEEASRDIVVANNNLVLKTRRIL